MNRVDQTQNPAKPLARFLHSETASGAILFLASAAALACANSPWAESYEHFRDLALFRSDVSVHFLVNEVLMAIFFLAVGLEIRREIHDGALSSVRAATLPLVAALGGIVTPALIYFWINGGVATLRPGWAVPTATDIAFAVGVLALLGKRIPPPLRVLLLAIAIADDIAAVLIIAFFYANGIQIPGIVVAIVAVVCTTALHKYAVRMVLPYVICAVALWYGLLSAGIHPALAGVIFGLITPMTASSAPGQPARTPPALRLETALRPWVAFAIMPIFAFTNAGVTLSGFDVESTASLSLVSGIVLGLLVGKPLGIVTASALAVRSGICALPSGVTWRGTILVGCLGGIGFTMSIFVATLAFPDPQLLAAAKLGVLLASALAGTIGLFVGSLLFSARNAHPPRA